MKPWCSPTPSSLNSQAHGEGKRCFAKRNSHVLEPVFPHLFIWANESWVMGPQHHKSATAPPTLLRKSGKMQNSKPYESPPRATEELEQSTGERKSNGTRGEPIPTTHNIQGNQNTKIGTARSKKCAGTVSASPNFQGDQANNKPVLTQFPNCF